MSRTGQPQVAPRTHQSTWRLALSALVLGSLSGCGLIEQAVVTPFDKAIDRTDDVFEEHSVAMDFVAVGKTTREEIRSAFGPPVPVTLSDPSMDVYAVLQDKNARRYVVPGQGKTLNRVNYAIVLLEFAEDDRLQSMGFMKTCTTPTGHSVRNFSFPCNPASDFEVIDLRAGLPVGDETLYLLSLFDEKPAEQQTKAFDRLSDRCSVYVFSREENEEWPRRYLLSGPEHDHTVLGSNGYAHIEAAPGPIQLAVYPLDVWGNSAKLKSPAGEESWDNELRLDCEAGQIFFVAVDYEQNFWNTSNAVSLELVDEGIGRPAVEAKRLLRR